MLGVFREVIREPGKLPYAFRQCMLQWGSQAYSMSSGIWNLGFFSRRFTGESLPQKMPGPQRTR